MKKEKKKLKNSFQNPSMNKKKKQQTTTSGQMEVENEDQRKERKNFGVLNQREGKA